jgi:hydroxypyruvate isomerase
MKYEQLDDSYRDDHIAQALYAREMEWFHYDVDRKNFAHMLKSKALPKAMRDDLEKRIADIAAHQDMVQRVMAALRAQIRSADAHAAAMERTRLKR